MKFLVQHHSRYFSPPDSGARCGRCGTGSGTGGASTSTRGTSTRGKSGLTPRRVSGSRRRCTKRPTAADFFWNVVGSVLVRSARKLGFVHRYFSERNCSGTAFLCKEKTCAVNQTQCAEKRNPNLPQETTWRSSSSRRCCFSIWASSSWRCIPSGTWRGSGYGWL